MDHTNVAQQAGHIGIPASFANEYQQILQYESWRKSVGVQLSQFATIRQLERPFAEELVEVSGVSFVGALSNTMHSTPTSKLD